MCNHGQQQFFTDVIKLSLKSEKFFFFFVNDYEINESEKKECFKNFSFITIEEYHKLKDIDIALHTEIYCRSPHVKERCFIGHGFPGKQTQWSTENSKSFNHYFMYGERDKEYFEFVTRGDSSIRKNIKFWEVGYPKYDYLFKTNESEKSTIKSLIGLNDKKATILYAPAWDPCGIHRTKGNELIKVFKKLNAYNFLIKLHPALLTSKRSNHYDFYTGGIDWYSEIKNATSGLSFRKQNVFFPDFDSINPLINVSDLLLTDFSGVALGFFLENKPVICIDCPDFYSKTLMEQGSDGEVSKTNQLFNNGRDASFVIEDINSLSKTIPHVLSNPCAMETQRLQIAKRLLFNPGNGTKVFVETLINILRTK
jgi:hypothetical protein